MRSGVTTDIWVAALVRRAQAAGAFATVVRRGDAERGDVLVKVSPERGRARLYAPAFTLDGPAERRVRADRDLWVVEIEDKEGRHFLTERVRA